MAIAYDATSTGKNGGATSLTFSHTCSGANRLLFVVTEGSGSGIGTVTGVTYNGVALTNSWDSERSSIYHSTGWYLKNPATGANDIVISRSPSGVVQGIGVSFTGVDQTTPVDASAIANGYSNTPTVDISSAVNDWVIDGVMTQFDPTVGAGQTERNASDEAGEYHHCSTENGAATVTMSWSTGGSAGNWCTGGASINPAAAGGLSIPVAMHHHKMQGQ